LEGVAGEGWSVLGAGDGIVGVFVVENSGESNPGGSGTRAKISVADDIILPCI
jgi:hypothetical protein